MSNLSPSSPLPAHTPIARARKRRAKRGIVANYIHEISPRHRAAPSVAAALPVAPVVPVVPAVAPASEPVA